MDACPREQVSTKHARLSSRADSMINVTAKRAFNTDWRTLRTSILCPSRHRNRPLADQKQLSFKTSQTASDASSARSDHRSTSMHVCGPRFAQKRTPALRPFNKRINLKQRNQQMVQTTPSTRTRARTARDTQLSAADDSRVMCCPAICGCPEWVLMGLSKRARAALQMAGVAVPSFHGASRVLTVQGVHWCFHLHKHSRS